MKRLIIALILVLLTPLGLHAKPLQGSAGSLIDPQVISRFNSPWALSFIDQDQVLVTTKPGRVYLAHQNGKTTEISGFPEVFEGGQGGLGDITLHPDFNQNNLVYFSFVASDDGGVTRFAKVMRGTLDINTPPKITNLKEVWRQFPATRGQGHFSHRLAFAPENSAFAGDLFITSGDRQLQTPAQDWDNHLGKIIRLRDDGAIPDDNPFKDQGEVAKSFWSMGHRNALGLSFDLEGQLWAHEMGPRHGDELNMITKGHNYGWPLVSEGDHYSGADIPAHQTRPDFTPPKAFWVPTIAPSGLIFYDGAEFPQFQGHALIGGLRSRALIRVAIDDHNAVESERFEWSKRVRDVALSPDGSIWVIEDGKSGRLIRFTNPNNATHRD